MFVIMPAEAGIQMARIATLGCYFSACLVVYLETQFAMAREHRVIEPRN